MVISIYNTTLYLQNSLLGIFKKVYDIMAVTNAKGCIVHFGDEKCEDLVTIKGKDSWQSLYNCAELLTYQPILDVAKTLEKGEVPVIHYHRNCRSRFMLKGNKKRKPESENTDEPKPKRLSIRNPSLSKATVYYKLCSVCQKPSKYIKGTRTREPIIQCLDLSGDKTLRPCAIKKGDSRMIAYTSRELVAAEGYYHKSCYKDYTRQPPNTEESIESADLGDAMGMENGNGDAMGMEVNDDDNSIYTKILSESYDELFETTSS